MPFVFSTITVAKSTRVNACGSLLRNESPQFFCFHNFGNTTIRPHRFLSQLDRSKKASNTNSNVHLTSSFIFHLPQQWTGWPSVTGLDDTVLAMAGLDLPQHELTVRRAPGKQKEYKRVNSTVLVPSLTYLCCVVSE